jgi:colanic acid biosynthesis glycosyl transferase WcaI
MSSDAEPIQLTGMRVLFINQYFPPDASATAYLLGELSEDLARQHEVWVVAGRPSYNPEGSSFVPKGVHTVRSWSTTFARAGMIGRLCNYATYVLSSAFESLRVPRPDVVVAMTDPPVVGLVGLLAARRHRAPFVYVCQDIFPDVGVALKRIDGPAAVWAWRKLNGLLRRGAARVVAIGRDMAELLGSEGVPREKIVVLPNWADGERPAEAAIAGARTTAGWDGRFVVMHGGNIGLAQRLDVVVEAADLLRDREEIRFAFLGDGAARPGLQDEVERLGLSNVEFLPYRPKAEAQALLAAADIHLISLAPGLLGCVVPSKLYGILALGRPFVAAVQEGSEIDRVCEETRAGIRTDPGDSKGMAIAISEFADGLLDGADAGARGREEFEDRYERSVATAGYLRLIESLRGGPKEGQKV